MLLVKCNNGSFSDLKGHTFSNVGIVTSAVEKKFGTSSCYFDGSSYLLNNSTDWNFGTDNFTAEAWTNSANAASGIIATCSRYFGGYIGFTMQYDYALIGTQQGPVDEITPFLTAPLASQWNHLALVRNNGSLTYYLNGHSIGTISATLTINSNALVIGMISPNQVSYIFSGYMDQIRITKQARYVTDFTPSATEFPEQ
ncbi:MAG: LamG domain-containing protein [Bacteriovorax sp.]|nr:LamG domain-containing protein [Bacteriovorax sp.]